MAQKPLLHELLREDQEPFHLKTYITNKRSQLRTETSLQIRKRRPLLHENPSKRTNLCKHACFFSFHASPDVRRSPFPDLPSPAKSPCKSPNAAVFLHIPSRTAALLVEAAMRIQKQQLQSKPRAQPRTGFGLLGSLLKRLKDRSKNRKRAIGDSDFNKVAEESEKGVNKAGESVGVSCSCSNRRLSSADWTENNEDNKSLDFEASTSSRASELSEEIGGGGGFFMGDEESCFCSSPFRFSLQQSPSSPGRRTPDFRSPSASPSRRVKQEKEKLDNVQGEEEEEKEQCSPVSILDPPFDEDDEHESRGAEEDDKDEEEEEEDDDDDDDDDYDMECSYENVQRAKHQLLHRLRRFEMLAELNPVELERKLLEGSDDEGQVELDGDEPVLSQSNFRYSSRVMSADMKRLVSDLIVEEKREMFQSCGNEVVMGRILNRLDSWKGVEFDTIDMMIGLDFKKELDNWSKFSSQVQETAAEIEVAIFVQIIEELTEDLGI